MKSFILKILTPLLLPFGLALLICGCGGTSPTAPPVKFSTLDVAHSEILASPPHYNLDAQVALSPLDGEIYVMWTRHIGGVAEILWRHGQPGAFGPEESVSELDGFKSWSPSIAAGTNGRLHFAWMDQLPDGIAKEIHAKSWDGDEWGDDVLLSLYDDWTSWNPDIEIFPDDRPAVVWFDHRFNLQHEIILRAGDGYGHWQPDVRLTNDNHWQYFPDVEIDRGGKIHLSYVDTRYMLDEWEDPDHYDPGRNLEIFYRTWSGGQPDAEIRITNSPLRSIGSHIAVDDSGTVHMIFLDESKAGYWVLYYVNIKDNVVSLLQRVSSSGAKADFGAIDTMGDRVVIVWPEYPDSESFSYDDTDLYIMEILPDDRFGFPRLLASEPSNLHPSIEVDVVRNIVWVVWMEYEGQDQDLMEGESAIRLAGIELRD